MMATTTLIYKKFAFLLVASLLFTLVTLFAAQDAAA
jgi:hypothetical protein